MTESSSPRQAEEILEDQLRWIRAAAMPSVRETIVSALTTTQLRQAFELCDGTLKSNEIAAKVGVSKQAFSSWTRRWRNLGIAYEVEQRRVCHLISLAALELPLEVKEEKGGRRDGRRG